MNRIGRPFWLLSLCLVACTSPDGDGRVEHSKRILQLEQENAELRRRNELLRQRAPIGTTQRVIRLSPSIDARVLAFHSRAQVLLDKGSRDGVSVSFVFDIYSGTTYKGQVRVIAVDETTSLAEVVLEKHAITPGDDATTTL